MNRYPLWRYLLLIVFIILGLIYAAPNLFGDDPAIEVSPKGTTELNPQVMPQIKTVLQQQQLGYKSIQRKPYSVLVRFTDINQQLKAQDILQATLGPNYTVALNLAERTPRWLKALGAQPMKLGLDLRGGIHFLLEVDVQQMLRDRLQSDSHAISNELQQAHIRYTGIEVKAQQLVVQFSNIPSRNQALKLLSNRYTDYRFSVANTANTYTLVGVFTPIAVNQLQQYAVSQNLVTLRNRVNELGVAEPVIQQQGKNQISVDLPGIQDTARAKAMIGKVATIRLQLQDLEHDAQAAAQSGVVPFGSSLYYFEGRPYLLKNQIILHGSSIQNATTTVDNNGRPAVSIHASGSEVASFNRITQENIGRPLATVYVETETVKHMVNGKLVMQNRQIAKIINMATINEALGNMFQITGLESQRAAQDLALQLRSGAYTAPVMFVQERLIGPSLGKDNIHKGILSTVMGALLVIVFMAFYYRIFGVIADLALLLNIVFVVAIMSILGATLTLPGIAGIVLTVGMAVDANVLINERIREELRNGMSPQASIHAGYERAFTTIVDANVSTLIVALILFTLGTGTVQGFAIVLIIGLITSMVTAIFFTRALVNLTYGRQRHLHKVSIGIPSK